MNKNPIEQFAQWFNDAQRAKGVVDATAFCLSTVAKDGSPEGRMVLMKDFDERGFVFYTNLKSVKGRAIAAHPQAAITFHWAPLERSVRIQGSTELVSDAEADRYWVTRPRATQIGAWASHQSEELSSRAVLLKDAAKFALKFGVGPVPRPPHWTGVRIIPQKIEFWQGQPSRLHDRFLFTKAGKSWKQVRLYP